MGLDFSSIFGKLLSSVGNFLFSLIQVIGVILITLVVGFVLTFFIRYRINPFRLDIGKLRKIYIKNKYFNFFRWLLFDFLEKGKHLHEFREYGFTFYVGRQGAGKTISMVRYLEMMKERYPECLIVTNFGYYRANYMMRDWHDLLTIRNGTKGVIFAIDEIHSEYSSLNWKDCPESLLSEISQQRKQRIKIVATAQYFSRVAKPLREQAFSVVSCSCLLGRLVRCREYDSLDYMSILENPVSIKKKIKPLRRYSYVAGDPLRECYDTYEKIERMKKIKFIPRNQRAED